MAPAKRNGSPKPEVNVSVAQTTLSSLGKFWVFSLLASSDKLGLVLPLSPRSAPS